MCPLYHSFHIDSALYPNPLTEHHKYPNIWAVKTVLSSWSLDFSRITDYISRDLSLVISNVNPPYNSQMKGNFDENIAERKPETIFQDKNRLICFYYLLTERNVVLISAFRQHLHSKCPVRTDRRTKTRRKTEWWWIAVTARQAEARAASRGDCPSLAHCFSLH